VAFEVFEVFAVAVAPPDGLFTAGPAAAVTFEFEVFAAVEELLAGAELLGGVLSITTVFELEEVLDPVAPPLKVKVDPPVLVEEPLEPPRLITVPPAVFVPTEPFPIKLAAELVFD